MSDVPHRPAGDDADWVRPDELTHRGGFGTHGGESDAFIERSFRERIVLVGVATGAATLEEVEASLDELALLVDTAGADPVARLVQRRDRPDPATYLGSGKVAELRRTAEAVDCDTVVFDDELTPAQQRNLEKQLGRTAIDRTAVILDIFAQNAASQEGKAQVQLALYRYRLPRLRGRGTSLSQQAGGIGARRGPGETQLEVDRRRILRHVHRLEAQLRDLARARDVRRKRRDRSRLATVALVGYTNAGKSTLLNRLTDAGVLVQDRLFATLDATTRRLALPGGETVLATDTVGFVRKLPHQLVEAFRSTLHVAAEADLLVHLVDGSSPDPEGELAAVRSVLAEIGAGDVPELLCVNKLDRARAAGCEAEVARLLERYPGSVAISARTGDGVEELLVTIGDRLRVATAVVDLLVPWDRGDVLASVHREGEVLDEAAGERGMALRARLDVAGLGRLADYVVAT